MKKYPRTPHLPWSPGASPDDERVVDVASFVDRRVIVTEKMDGECTTIWQSLAYARSLDTARHPSRSIVRALAGQIALPDQWRIVGENVYARHSIAYSELPDHFLVFGIHVGDHALSWAETTTWAGYYGLKMVPRLYEGPWDEDVVRECWTGKSLCGGEQEGYVVRLADSFALDNFGQSVAKYVRAGHVQTDDHWMRQTVVRNGLR